MTASLRSASGPVSGASRGDSGSRRITFSPATLNGVALSSRSRIPNANIFRSSSRSSLIVAAERFCVRRCCRYASMSPVVISATGHRRQAIRSRAKHLSATTRSKTPRIDHRARREVVEAGLRYGVIVIRPFLRGAGPNTRPRTVSWCVASPGPPPT